MRGAAALLLLLALPGCSAPAPGNAGAALAFDGVAMQVTTHPDEPNEPPGKLEVAWSGQAMSIDSDHEPDLARRTLAFPDQVDLSYIGLGWTRHERAELATGRLSNRILLWDLPALLREPGLAVTTRQEQGLDNTSAAGHVRRDGVDLDVRLWVRSRGGVPEEAWLASPQGRESPYRFSRLPTAAPAFGVPAPLRPAEEAERLDAQAHDGHTQIILLIQDYAAKRAGALPDRVDADTLRVELLAAGQVWPANPYDGQAQRAARASGAFAWAKCGPASGNYVGYGWDTALMAHSFGSGCPS